MHDVLQMYTCTGEIEEDFTKKKFTYKVVVEALKKKLQDFFTIFPEFKTLYKSCKIKH